MIAKQSDLTGFLQGIPLIIVLAMQREQCRQGNSADVAVFKRRITSSKASGGFNWANPNEQGKIVPWYSILISRNFEMFFNNLHRL